MSICRGCPHYSWEIAIAYSDGIAIRFINSCAFDLPRAGYRETCTAKPKRDTGERRRVTDLTGQSEGNPDNEPNTQTSEVRR